MVMRTTYLVQILKLDTMENHPYAAAHYETIGVTREIAVTAFVQNSYNPTVDPEECWALGTASGWKTPIKRFRLQEIPSIDTMTALKLAAEREGVHDDF